jgi:TonB family protein
MLIALLLALAVQHPDSLTPADSLDAPPEIIQGPRLYYPIDLLQNGRQGRVMVEFVLDTTGRAEKGSIRVVATPHMGFNLAAKAYIRDAVFTAATFHGRKVRTRVRMPVDFRIHGGS